MATYAFVSASADNSLTILDVTNPAAPAFAAQLVGAGLPNYLGEIMDVATVGDYAYCFNGNTGGTGDNGITIVNISNPLVPVFAGKLNAMDDNVFKFGTISGNYAYISSSYMGTVDKLYIVDISNPALPAIAGSITGVTLGVPAGNIWGRPYKLGNYCYLPIGPVGYLVIVDVTNPAAPSLIGTVIDGTKLAGFECFVLGNYCYVADQSNSSLTIVDVTNKALPAIIGNIAGVGSPNFLSGIAGVWKEGNYCYCGSINGLTVINVTNPAVPTFVSNLPTVDGQDSYGIYKSGNYCYLPKPSGNIIYICDVSNPATPALSGSLSGAGAPNFLGQPYVIALKGSWIPPTPTSPTITNISPAYGTVNGGTAITITGTDFVATPTVTIGGRSCTGVTLVSATEVTAVTPSGKPGDRDVVLTNPDAGTVTLTKGFKYLHSKTKCCVASYVLSKICPNGIIRFR